MIEPRDGKRGRTFMARPYVQGKALPARTFKTEREAKGYEREMLSKFDRLPSEETCRTMAGRWLDDYPIVKQGPTRGRERSAGTRATYQSALDVFVETFPTHITALPVAVNIQCHSARTKEAVL